MSQAPPPTSNLLVFLASGSHWCYIPPVLVTKWHAALLMQVIINTHMQKHIWVKMCAHLCCDMFKPFNLVWKTSPRSSAECQPLKMANYCWWILQINHIQRETDGEGERKQNQKERKLINGWGFPYCQQNCEYSLYSYKSS